MKVKKKKNPFKRPTKVAVMLKLLTAFPFSALLKGRKGFLEKSNNKKISFVCLLFFSTGKEKLGVPLNESVSFVLESDGTAVEDGEYFRTLANNTILILLRHGERWCPTGADVIRAGDSIKDFFDLKLLTFAKKKLTTGFG